MVNMAKTNIFMGYWHNWSCFGMHGYNGGSCPSMNITEVNSKYNVVVASFMKCSPAPHLKNSRIPSFTPFNRTPEQFRNDVRAMNNQGRAVLISLGGADAKIALRRSDEDELVQEIIYLVHTYGFNGVDIDLEQTAITAGDNETVIPNALKTVKRGLGDNFIITMAPEFPYLRTDGRYIPYINSLSGYYDFIAPQFYNQGGDGVFANGRWYAQDSDDLKASFLYYMADSLINGTRGYTCIPANKLVLGLPANQDAAGTGYVRNRDHVYSALNQLKNESNRIRGLMTWSANWDCGQDRHGNAYNNKFARQYGDFIRSY